jgi:anti-anti-sigma factor
VTTMSDEDRPIAIDVRHDNGNAWMKLRGDLDLASTPAVRNAVVELLQSGSRELRVDLADLGYMDSVGLSFFLSTHRRMEEEGRRLVIVNPSTPVARLLTLTGTQSFLHVEPALDPPT